MGHEGCVEVEANEEGTKTTHSSEVVPERDRCLGVSVHGDVKGASKHKAVYRSGATLAEEGVRESEKDAKIERSLLRVAVGEPRGAELPNKDRRGVGGGVRWEVEAEPSDAAGSSTFHESRGPDDVIVSDPRSARW